MYNGLTIIEIYSLLNVLKNILNSKSQVPLFLNFYHIAFNFQNIHYHLFQTDGRENGVKKKKNYVGYFYRPGLEYTSTPFTLHWLELRLLVTLNCNGGWHMQSSYMFRKKGKTILQSKQQSLSQESLGTKMALWTCELYSHTGLHAQKSSTLGLMIYCYYLEILNIF